ncbi:WD40/YVTN/BNR-like repeat-containing protein [Shewanella gaetbuli]|uniref:YCF48-related protein n=1 Tax=Shewanella gaetbuli TaxID=220752 RepID=A0A9X2CMX8_9GAMM|nr:YCF48-related protein [Shewanella gaetbuli]MCL1144140.1 YCF48-related protein [Shewanella gaetbuli]
MTVSMLRSTVALSLSACLYTASVSAQFDPLSAQIQPLAQSSLLVDIANAGDTLVAVGQRGHVLVLNEKWQQVNTPVLSQLTKVFFLNANLGWAVGHDATILHTQDGGQTWSLQMQSTDIEKPFLDILFFDENHGVAVGAYGLFYRTQDGGKTWVDEFHQELLFEEDIAYLNDLKAEDEQLYLSERAALLPHFNRIINISNDRLLLVGELGTVAVSDDQGQTFSTVEFDYDGSMFNAITHNGDIYVMGLRGHVFKTNDSFDGWEQLELPVESSINGALVHEGNLYLVGNAGIILKVKDTQATIVERRQGENIVSVAKNNQGDIWFAGSKGLFQLPQ